MNSEYLESESEDYRDNYVTRFVELNGEREKLEERLSRYENLELSGKALSKTQRVRKVQISERLEFLDSESEREFYQGLKERGEDVVAWVCDIVRITLDTNAAHFDATERSSLADKLHALSEEFRNKETIPDDLFD